jgi:peptidoglycan/LPS O-acetylase OafA/YrhL
MILFELNLLFSGEFSKIQGASFNRGWLHGMYQFRLSWPEAMYEGIIGTLFHYNKEHIYNSVLWTMEKEWWGSVGCFIYIILRKKSPYATLIYPIIMGVAMKTGQTWIICFAGGLAISEITTYADIDSPQTVFSKLNQLLHYFFSGRTGFILLIAAIFIARYKNYFGLMNPAIAEILVCLALYHKGFVSFLSSRWLVRLGTLSFGFYLIHMPVICSLSCYLLSIGQPIYIVLFSSLSVIVLSGMLFQKYIDKPAVMLSGKLNTFAQNEN